MTRRLVRTATQLVVLSLSALFLVFFLDSRYRVLPTSLHNRLPKHHIGHVVTDITLTTCKRISILGSCSLDSTWERIYKDVYLEEAWINQGYLHVKKKVEKELHKDDKVVLDVRIARKEPVSDDKIKWEKRPGGIWIKRGKLSDEAVTSVDLLFGPDAVDPRVGWELKGSLTIGKEARLTIRRGHPEPPKKPELRIRKDGKFKIVQVADIHLSTGTGVCRDPSPASTAAGCEADPRSLEFLEKMLDIEKPDLAVLTGDQVNGETAPDAQSAVFKFAEVFIKRKIPYATIYGNHDDEGSLNRLELMTLTQSLPYSLSERGPSDIPGIGNYYVEILAHSSQHPATTIFLLDTHSYSPDEKTYHGYDWIKTAQIEWFRNTHTSLQPSNKQYAHHHLDIAFIHIPLPEYRVSTNKWKGNWIEAPTAPAFNSKFKDALVGAGVSMVSCGHDHVNDYCMLDKTEDASNLWMCYGGGAGFGGYGGYNGYIRRLRFFEIDAPLGRITTWKRLEYGDVGPLDEQIIVDAGKVADMT